MSSHTHSPRRSRFFLSPSAHEGEGMPAGVCLMQALGTVAVAILGFGPAFALIVGAMRGSDIFAS